VSEHARAREWRFFIAEPTGLLLWPCANAAEHATGLQLDAEPAVPEEVKRMAR